MLYMQGSRNCQTINTMYQELSYEICKVSGIVIHEKDPGIVILGMQCFMNYHTRGPMFQELSY